MPLATVRPGMVGQGLTVVRGTTPQPFSVEVLGVLTDGIGAGRDLILVEVSDLSGRHVVDQGGGIWAGMSGSPVYVGGQLLGAISYGFTSSPSPIGGITPAADMLDLLATGDASTSVSKADVTGRQAATLSTSMRRQVAERATAAAPSATLTRLPLPVSVSGLNSRRLTQLQRDADTAQLSVVAYAGSAQAAPGGRLLLDRPVPGGNFAAAVSYGDVTVAGTGTTTAVCRNQALAFGHPFNFAGATTYGANDATALAIIKDNTYGSFKMANLGVPFGTVDQDRLAGIRSGLGAAPTTTPVVTTVTNLDRGLSRTGKTRVTDASWLPALSPLAVLANADSTFDEVGDGRATSTWSVVGTRAGGKPFSLTRSNRWASRDDVTFDPASDLGYAVDQLVNNEFERLTVRQVTFETSITTTFQQERITDLTVSVNGGAYTRPTLLLVEAGDTLRVKVTTQPFQSASTKATISTLKVPATSSGMAGALEVTGGQEVGQPDPEGESLSCLLAGEGCDEGQQANSLDDVIKGVASAPRNDDVVANLVLTSDEGDQTASTTARQRHTEVVAGQRSLEVLVRP